MAANMNAQTTGQGHAFDEHGVASRSMFGAGRDLFSPRAGSMHEMNVGNRERILSLILGGVGVLWLGKRLFGMGALAALSIYLLYRGLTGFCAIYARAQVNTRRGLAHSEPVLTKTSQANLFPGMEARPAGGSESGAVASNSGVVAVNSMTVGTPPVTITVERPNGVGGRQKPHTAAKGDEERHTVRGTPVDEASKQSFPASDPPAI